MTGTKSTRRRVLQGIGVGGTAAVLSGATIVSADEHEDEEEEEEEEEVEEEEEEEEEEEVEEEAEFAALRCGHLSPDAPNVDVYVGKTPDLNPTVGSLSYPRFGPGPNDGYLQLPPGTYDLEIAPFGGTDAVIEVEDVELEAGVRYSALAVGLLGGEPADDENGDEEDVTGTELQPLLIADAEGDDEATPPEDEAEVSFVHASPDAGTVDVVVDGETLLEDIDFGAVSDYFAVEPGEYEIVVESDGEPVLAVTRELRAGTSVTGYVTGVAGDEEEEAENDDEENDNDNDEEEAENDEEENDEEENDEEDVEESEEEDDDEEMEENDDEEMEENDDEEMEENDEDALPDLNIVTTLDGTNPLADGVVTR